MMELIAWKVPPFIIDKEIGSDYCSMSIDPTPKIYRQTEIK